MSKITNSRTRMEALVNGEPVDQIPVALWRHFPVDDQDPKKLATATIHFQNTFNFDFVKVSPASSFCLRDWGIKDRWTGNPEGSREYGAPIVETPDDWQNLPALDVTKGAYGRQLECLKIIRDNLGKDTPIIQTIFSPLSQAKNMVGKPNLYHFLRAYPQALMSGLEKITNNTLDFIEACRNIGIDGVFFAVQHASYDRLSLAEFEVFAKAYDRQLFPLIEEFWFNVIHVHGKNIMPDSVKDYPMQVFNWHDRDTYPKLKQGLQIFDKKVVCGGLGRIHPMELDSEIEIKAQIDDTIEQTKGRNFILGTGCVLQQTTPYGNIKTAVDYARSIRLT